MTRKSQEKLVQLPGAGTGMLKTGEARSAFNHATRLMRAPSFSDSTRSWLELCVY
jgi:hypothetical protein